MAELKTFPKKGDSPETFIKAADERLKGIRKLAKKPYQRWLWVGPRKKLSKNDIQYRKILERDELKFRSEGMRLKRRGSGRSTSRR